MFQLSKEEAKELASNIRCQNGTLSEMWFRYTPYAFARLSATIQSKTATLGRVAVKGFRKESNEKHNTHNPQEHEDNP